MGNLNPAIGTVPEVSYEVTTLAYRYAGPEAALYHLVPCAVVRCERQERAGAGRAVRDRRDRSSWPTKPRQKKAKVQTEGKQRKGRVANRPENETTPFVPIARGNTSRARNRAAPLKLRQTESRTATAICVRAFAGSCTLVPGLPAPAPTLPEGVGRLLGPSGCGWVERRPCQIRSRS